MIRLEPATSAVASALLEKPRALGTGGVCGDLLLRRGIGELPLPPR